MLPPARQLERDRCALAGLRMPAPYMVSTRLGSPSLRATPVAAAASVGQTAVPSTNAIGQDRSPSQCANAATPAAVATTSATASAPIVRALRIKAVGEEVAELWKMSSGSRPRRTTWGWSVRSGANGTRGIP